MWMPGLSFGASQRPRTLANSSYLQHFRRHLGRIRWAVAKIERSAGRLLHCFFTPKPRTKNNSFAETLWFPPCHATCLCPRPSARWSLEFDAKAFCAMSRNPRLTFSCSELNKTFGGSACLFVCLFVCICYEIRFLNMFWQTCNVLYLVFTDHVFWGPSLLFGLEALLLLLALHKSAFDRTATAMGLPHPLYEEAVCYRVFCLASLQDETQKHCQAAKRLLKAAMLMQAGRLCFRVTDRSFQATLQPTSAPCQWRACPVRFWHWPRAERCRTRPLHPRP